MLDFYLSWVAAIEEMRRRHQAGEPIGRLWREAEERQRQRSTTLDDIVIYSRNPRPTRISAGNIDMIPKLTQQHDCPPPD